MLFLKWKGKGSKVKGDRETEFGDWRPPCVGSYKTRVQFSQMDMPKLLIFVTSLVRTFLSFFASEARLETWWQKSMSSREDGIISTFFFLMKEISLEGIKKMQGKKSWCMWPKSNYINFYFFLFRINKWEMDNFHLFILKRKKVKVDIIGLWPHTP